MEDPDPTFRVQDAMMKFASLRSDIFHKRQTNPVSILEQALELDRVLVDISSNPPPGWEYQTVFTDIPSDTVYNGRYHIYHDYSTANVWNMLRTVRIMLNMSILRAIHLGSSAALPLFTDAQHTAQLKISTDVVHNLSADILYSVPQRLDLFPRAASIKTTEATSMLTYVMEGTSPVEGSGGSYLIWSLWFVGILDFSSEEVRGFVVRNLKSVALNLGIQQAAVLAKVVEEKIDIKEWG